MQIVASIGFHDQSSFIIRDLVVSYPESEISPSSGICRAFFKRSTELVSLPASPVATPPANSELLAKLPNPPDLALNSSSSR